MSVPASRSLPVVLRALLNADTPLKLMIATVGAALTGTEANAYVNVVVEGATVKVPKLNGAASAVGGPAYLLASADFLLYLGSVSTAAPAAGPPGPAGPAGPTGPAGATGATGPVGPATFISGSGAPSSGVGVDGAFYLDTATGRLYGPKTAGAWPGTALGRIMPLAPTYAQVKAG